MKLKGKIAIVTGGAVRLGREMSMALARAGCDIAVHFNSSTLAAQETVNEIRSMGNRSILIQADLSDPAIAASKIVGETYEHFGQIDILVNNAAVFEPGRLDSTEESNWDSHFDINLKAPFFLSREFVAHLTPVQKAHIVNIADGANRIAIPNHLAYTLTKNAIVTLTQMLACEVGPKVMVNAIAPGAILPGRNSDEKDFMMLSDSIPLKRTGTPEDVTRTLLYLLESEFVTGEIVHVTGGQQLGVTGRQENQ